MSFFLRPGCLVHHWYCKGRFRDCDRGHEVAPLVVDVRSYFRYAIVFSGITLFSWMEDLQPSDVLINGTDAHGEPCILFLVPSFEDMAAMLEVSCLRTVPSSVAPTDRQHVGLQHSTEKTMIE